MRPNNRQRSRGGRNGGGGGGGGHQHHKQQHHGGGQNPNRPPNRNQLFDSSGPDVRVRGNAHQVFDKYQALAREAASSGDRIMAEAYWQYADHYYRMIQSMGGFVQRNNQGWGDGEGEGAEGQQGGPQQQGQPNGPPPGGGTPNSNGYAQGEHQQDEHQQQERQQQERPQQHERPQHQQHERPQHQQHRRGGRDEQEQGESEPGLGGVAFLQSGRGAPPNPDPDPAADEQPDIPEFSPAGAGRRG